MDTSPLERLKAEAEGRTDGYSRMAYFLQQALSLSNPRNERTWRQLATEELAAVVQEPDRHELGTTAWRKWEAARRAYTSLLQKWVVAPDAFLDELHERVYGST